MSTYPIINDRAELDALPPESVVRDHETAICEKWPPDIHGTRHWRQVADEGRWSVNDIILPAELLYIPEEKA